MAVTLVATIERFVGLSSDTKPGISGQPAPTRIGSEFTEFDTGARYVWDGARWNLVQTTIDQLNAVNAGITNSILDEILNVLTQATMRLDIIADALAETTMDDQFEELEAS